MKSTWVEDASSLPGGRTFRRPLGLTEQDSYWDSVFRGTLTTINDFEVACEGGDVFTRENVTRAWLHLKQMFPLLGCRVEERPGPSSDAELLEFVVEEGKLDVIRADEINFLQVNSPAEVDRQCHIILNSSDYLDASKAVARLWILRRTDIPSYFHILFQLAHITHDGFAITTVIKAFCNAVLTPNLSQSDLTSMEDRLGMVVALEDLDPALEYSLARRRWWRAIAKVIFCNQQNRLHVRITISRCETIRQQ